MTQSRARAANFAAVVVGASAGGFEALTKILPALTKGFSLPVLVAQHLHHSDEGRFAQHLARLSARPVFEAYDKQEIEPGCVYIAPANYHMLVERSLSIALSVDRRVNWSRPSIDVLFDSAARVWKHGLVAVLLSGANRDGVEGMAVVRRFGGLTIAEDPETAISPGMPRAAVDAGQAMEILEAEVIGRRLADLGAHSRRRADAGNRQDAEPHTARST